MNYQKYDLKKYNLHIIKTDKFKTITVTINFKRKAKKDEITIRKLLTDVLLESSLKYPSRRLIDMETEELYGLELSNSCFVSGNYNIMSFKGTFLNEKYTEEGMNKRSILFILNLLLNPDIKDNCFSEYGFELGKRIIQNDIKTYSDYPNSYSMKRMLEIIAPKTPLSYRNCGYIKDLKKITTEELASYYHSVIEDDIIDISIIGDIDDDVITLFENNFTRKNDNQKSDTHFVKINNKISNEKKEKANINQSRLVVGCLIDIDDVISNQYALNIYSFILGGSGDSLLFQTVREKNSLCYNISSSFTVISNLLTIRAGIDADKYKKTLKLIKECMDKIENGDFDEEDIEKAKIIYKNSCIETLDSPIAIIDNYLSHEYLNTDLIEDRMKKIDTVTKEMIIELAHKIHISTVYLLEGDNNERDF